MKALLLNDKTVHYFESRFFEVDGEAYEIVGSESTGRGSMDVRHRVRVGKKRKTMKQGELIKLFQSGRLGMLPTARRRGEW